jgi:membrane protein implicated in regulation of membrane protease activity
MTTQMTLQVILWALAALFLVIYLRRRRSRLNREL